MFKVFSNVSIVDFQQINVSLESFGEDGQSDDYIFIPFL